MTFVLAAIGRADIADYVDALFLVYLILIFVRILLSWIPRMPYNPVLQRRHQLRPRRHRPVPAALPALHAAGRRRRLRARPEPDRRDHRALIVRAIVVGLIRADGEWTVNARRRPCRRLGAGRRAGRDAVVVALDQIDEAARRRARRARRARRDHLRLRARERPQRAASRSGCSRAPATRSCWRSRSGALALLRRLLRRPCAAPGPVARGRADRGRGARQPRRPPPDRRGDRLPRPAAVAGVQPRRRRDRRRASRCCVLIAAPLAGARMTPGT